MIFKYFYVHCGVDACLLRMVLKWTPEGSNGVCDSDTLRLRLVCNIGRRKGASLSILIEYTLETWFGKSLA